MKWTGLLCATGVAVLLPGSALLHGGEPPVKSPPPPPPPLALLEIRVQNGRALIPARVNESPPLSFLLDTGYSINTIHPDLVASLNLRRAGKVTIVGIAGEEDAPMYAGASFRFGEATYEPRRVAAVPSEGQSRRRRDGIIGSGFFRRFVVEMDVRKKSVRLFEPAGFEYSGPGHIVPLGFRRETPIIDASIVRPDEGLARGRFEIDTGCDDGVCLGHDFVKQNELEAIADKDRPGVKLGVGGEARVRPATIDRFQLGSATAEKVSASIFQDGSPAGEGLAGHIGMGALRQFRVTFDYSRRQMILEKHP